MTNEEWYDQEKICGWASLRSYRPTIDRYVLANIFDEETGKQFRENNLIQIIAPLIPISYHAQSMLYADEIYVCAKEINHPDRRKIYRLYYTTDNEDENICVFNSSYFIDTYRKIVSEPINRYFREAKICLGLNPDRFFSNMDEAFSKVYHEFYNYDNFGKEDHVSFPILSEIRANLAEEIYKIIQEKFKGEDAYIEIRSMTKVYTICEIKASE